MKNNTAILKSKKKVNNWSVLFVTMAILLVLVDVFLLWLLASSRRAEREYGYVNTAATMEYIFRNNVDYAAKIATGLSMSLELDEFLEGTYESTEEYFDRYREVVTSSGLFKVYSVNTFKVDVYSDNDSIVNGGGIYRMEKAKNTGWYQRFENSGQDSLLLFYYDDDEDTQIQDMKRKLLYIRRLKYFKGRECEKICKIEINYSALCENMTSALTGRVGFLSQDGFTAIDVAHSNSLVENFDTVDMKNVAYIKDFVYTGNTFSVIIPEKADGIVDEWGKNWGYVMILLLINLSIPILFSRLFQAMQRGRLREQEMDIARQNAELLALHSQINPHFLFNALETIRMHSILRGEMETAEMVESLAVIERKNADWNEDEITIENEMDFVDAYLNLQRYRFGERLSYEVDIEKGCENIKIPRLSIVTFVENACVHGIEGKSSPGWIFVRVYTEEENVVIEVEDTGEGIDEEALEALRDKMENASIEKLKQKGRIGVVNACLRLKIYTENEVKFLVESEENIGTTIQVFIPVHKVKRH